MEQGDFVGGVLHSATDDPGTVSMMLMSDPRNRIPDVRDGLTKIERVVLHELARAEREFGGRNVPTATLYGRVLEHVDISREELQMCLQRLVHHR